MVVSRKRVFVFTERLAGILNDDASNVYLFLDHSFFFIVYHSSTSIRESFQLYAEDLLFLVPWRSSKNWNWWKTFGSMTKTFVTMREVQFLKVRSIAKGLKKLIKSFESHIFFWKQHLLYLKFKWRRNCRKLLKK